MSHPARGPDRRSGIDGRANAIGGRRVIVGQWGTLWETAA
jgi:hypothetical protein